MRVELNLPDGLLAKLQSHLFRPGGRLEEAAFLFARHDRDAKRAIFTVAEHELMAPTDFDIQEVDYLELTDEARARIIKRAHHLNASIVEVHSHPGPFPAAFSSADWQGLAETVPHVWWRLKGSPYLALVFARSGFDALVWLDDPATPQTLDSFTADRRLFSPTNHSLWKWRQR